jgi:hypothetical protein
VFRIIDRKTRAGHVCQRKRITSAVVQEGDLAAVGGQTLRFIAGQLVAEQIEERAQLEATGLTVDPNASITPGSQAGVMPTTYRSQLTMRQIADLVALLLKRRK